MATAVRLLIQRFRACRDARRKARRIVEYFGVDAAVRNAQAALEATEDPDEKRAQRLALDYLADMSGEELEPARGVRALLKRFFRRAFELASVAGRRCEPLMPNEARSLLKEMRSNRAAEDGAAVATDLSPRQIECLKWTALGKTSGEIGIIIGRSDRTVDEHIKNACTKLGVYRRMQAVIIAEKKGLLRANP